MDTAEEAAVRRRKREGRKVMERERDEMRREERRGEQRCGG